MEENKELCINLENLNLIKKKSTNLYENGLKYFFNTRRNEIKITEIIHFLNIEEKMRILNLCRNFFRCIKREIDFNNINKLLEDQGIINIDEVNLLEIYNIISQYYKQHSLDEKSTHTYTESLIKFCALLINKKFLEHSRNNNNNFIKTNFEDWEFYNNKLDKFGLKIVTTILKFNKSLKNILIHGCHLDDSDLKLILDSLKQNSTLENLDVMYNDITDEGCKSLRDFLYTNQYLRGISIGMNKNITSLGIQFISYGLVGNTNLKILQLKGMGLGDDEKEIILHNFINHIEVLEKLELQNNKFTCFSIEFWKQGLIDNKNLLEINLLGNKINDEGVCIIIKILEKNKNLSKINLKGNVDIRVKKNDCDGRITY